MKKRSSASRFLQSKKVNSEGFTLISKTCKGFTLFSRSERAFTLIELLIVIVIITILAVIGMLAYNGLQGQAKDTKRKADVGAIAKAYETNYSKGVYPTLAPTNFTSGQVPKTPEGKDYPCLVGPSSNCTVQSQTKFATCVALGNQGSGTCYAPSDTCYCQSSSLGTTNTSGGGSSGGSGGSGSTGGGSSNPSCDPYGILNSQLVGYWKFNENSWNGTSGEVKDSSGNGNNGTAICYGTGCVKPQAVPGKFGNAANFAYNENWNTTAIDFGTTNSALNQLTDLTYSTWLKFSQFDDWDNSIILARYNPSIPYDKIYFNIGSYSGNPSSTILNPTDLSKSIWSVADDQKSVLTLNQWYLVTMTYSGSTDRKMRLYINGNEVYYSQQDTAPSTTVLDYTAMYMGGNSYVNGKYLSDDFRIYNRVLSPSEIQLMYNAGQGCVQ
ncbi:MAG: LamG domain-containing protein [Patescibacteria group bacterium]|nr:LamG domain-containing protein [Patescibacteria group bacterium]